MEEEMVPDLLVAVLMVVQLGVGFALGLFWCDLQSERKSHELDD